MHCHSLKREMKATTFTLNFLLALLVASSVVVADGELRAFDSWC